MCKSFTVTSRTEGHVLKNQISVELCVMAFFLQSNICILNLHPGFSNILKRQCPRVFLTLHGSFLFPALFNNHSSKAMLTTHLKSHTDHLLLIRGGEGTENFPWHLTFFAWMKNCYSGQDSVILLTIGAYSRSLLRFTCGVFFSEQKFVPVYLAEGFIWHLNNKKKKKQKTSA